MARPKSQNKKQALLAAATAAFAETGIAASTSVIARNAGVAEGTLFCYFATKDELINQLYLTLHSELIQTLASGLIADKTQPQKNARCIWQSYINWSIHHPVEYKAIRRLSLSERISDETRRQAERMFPEVINICQLSIKPVFQSDDYRAFGDALFLALAETTIKYASDSPTRAHELIDLGFETMWQALHNEVRQ
ncbi:TetR/AcrR family transcriptional regulator [Enterobacteriaceae bacterium ESL0689]|nr:TetR/AcrR family transcriptional regulator [Enterobacteriaceae bacterium ESL0689]